MDDPLLADTSRQDDTLLDPVSTPFFPDEATAASNSGLLPPLAHPEPPAPSTSPLDPPESGMDHAANGNGNDNDNDNCDCGDNDLAQDDPDCLCDDQDEPPCTVLTSTITRPSNNTATLVPNTTTTATVPHDADNPSYNSTSSQTLTLSYPPISCKPHKVTTRETLTTSTPTTTRTRTIMQTSLHRVSYLVTPSPVDWKSCLESLLSNCTTTPTSPPPPPATETSTVYVPKPFYKPVYIPLKQSSSSCTPATTTLSRRFIYSTRTSMVISTVSNANASASSHPTNTPTSTSTHAPAPATVTTTATMTAAPIAAAPVAAAAPVFMQPPPMPQYVMAQQQPILMPAQAAAAAPIAAAAPVAVSTATATTTSTATQTTTSTATQVQSPVYAVESYAVEEAAVASTTATTTGATPTSPSMFSAATYTATGWPTASTGYGAMMGITTTISGGLNSYMYAVYTSTIFNP